MFAQLLFWTDLFVASRYVSQSEVGVYSAALRAGQLIMLFLVSVNLMFAPFVADLYNRGERERLDGLYKTLTRWIVAATMPVFLLILITPESVLKIFGADFTEGQAALVILGLGQLANIATGSAGFVLIMVGRTGWDFGVYAASIVLDVLLAFWLVPDYGIEGAAVANAVTFAASNGARLLLVRRFVGIQPYDSRYARLLGPAAAAAAVMVLVHWAVGAGFVGDLVATGAVGVLVYVLAYLLVGLTPSERTAALGFAARLRTDRKSVV